MKRILTQFFLVLTGMSIAYSCGERADDNFESVKTEALQQYANLVYANYDDSYQTALTLKQAVDAFVGAPSQSGFDACKTAWLNARNSYGRSEAFRFYGGPIDDADGPEGLINAWPMDENFIDYVQGQPSAGLINNPQAQPVINKNILVGLNEVLSETAIFTGWHAIEFLLWGQDLSNSGPGARPFTDYVSGAGGTAANQDRRRTYLQVVTELLIEHIAQVRDEWAAGGAYRQEFLNNKTSAEAMGLIFFGLGEFTITELSGERMFVAIDAQDQEHEHSCFADNTIADLKMNLLGVKNVYYGSYTKSDGSVVSGRSFNDLLVLINKESAEHVDEAFEDAEAKLNAIPAPFDQSIANHTAEIEAAIEAIQHLGEHLTEAGKTIGAAF